jgi:hypothetical protein
MAGEIRVNLQANLVNGNLLDEFKPGQIAINQTTKTAFSPTLTIGTSEEALVFTDLTSLGCVGFRNLDPTNYVDIGPESGGAMVPMIRLLPGEIAWMRLKPGITVRAQANGAPIKLRVHAWDA